VDQLLQDIAAAQIGATFNQYAGAEGAVRLDNLRAYLAERAGASVVALGEAAGYQGMRWSGIAFTSERDLLRWVPPYRTTSPRPEGWSEPSGTIVHRVLGELGAERDVILWNTVPHHPHRPGEPLSNRRPTTAEIAAGAVFARQAIEMLRPRLVIAVGRVAEAAAGDLAHARVRHPANGGGTQFASGMARIFNYP
jgi:hypothetical protein